MLRYEISKFLANKININYMSISYESCPNCKVDDIIQLVITDTNQVFDVKVLAILAPERNLTKKQKQKIMEILSKNTKYNNIIFIYYDYLKLFLHV